MFYFLLAVIIVSSGVLLYLAYRDHKQEENLCRTNAFHICRIEVLEERNFLSATPFEEPGNDYVYEPPYNPSDTYYVSNNNSSSLPAENDQETDTSDLVPDPVYSYGFDENELPLVFSNNAANAQILAKTMSSALNNSSAAADLNEADQLIFVVEFTADNVSGWHYLICHDTENNTGAEVYLRIRNGKLQFGYWDSWSNHLAEVPVEAYTKYTAVAVFDETTWKLDLYSASGELLDSASIEYTPEHGITDLDVRGNGIKSAWFIGRHGTDTDQRPFCGTINKIAVFDPRKIASFNNPIIHGTKVAKEVTEIHWTIKRDNKPTASVTTKQGATIDELAKNIGFGTAPKEAGKQDDFRNWLKVTTATGNILLKDGRWISLAHIRATDEIAAGQTFEVPNTIVMAWFGDLDAFGKGWMNWEKNKKDIEKLGFHVEIFDNEEYDNTQDGIIKAKTKFSILLSTLSDSKQLHGLYMMGHGLKNTIGSNGAVLRTKCPHWDISYTGEDCIDSLLKYKLGALIIHACHSDNQNARELVSDSGIFHGKKGVYFPAPLPLERIAYFWGYCRMRTDHLRQIFRIGTLQGTNSFEVTFIGKEVNAS